MPKSLWEKQMEKDRRQAKQLADKQRREAEKRERERKRMEQKVMLQNQAASIVNGQPLVEDFRIMDKTAEEVLQCLLKCDQKKSE